MHLRQKISEIMKIHLLRICSLALLLYNISAITAIYIKVYVKKYLKR